MPALIEKYSEQNKSAFDTAVVQAIEANTANWKLLSDGSAGQFAGLGYL